MSYQSKYSVVHPRRGHQEQKNGERQRPDEQLVRLVLARIYPLAQRILLLPEEESEESRDASQLNIEEPNDELRALLLRITGQQFRKIVRERNDIHTSLHKRRCSTYGS